MHFTYIIQMLPSVTINSVYAIKGMSDNKEQMEIVCFFYFLNFFQSYLNICYFCGIFKEGVFILLFTSLISVFFLYKICSTFYFSFTSFSFLSLKASIFILNYSSSLMTAIYNIHSLFILLWLNSTAFLI